MLEYPQLSHTPIKEIVLTISFVEDVAPEALSQFCGLDKISSVFTKHDGFHAKIQTRKNQLPLTDITRDGYVLRSEKLNQILEVKKGLFSLHKIKEYEQFETLYDSLCDYWTHLMKFTGSLTIKNISLRYLNFIVTTEGETIDKLINISTQHPYKYKMVNKFLHLSFLGDDPNLKINIISSIGKDQAQDGVVLDIILNWNIQNNADYNQVISRFKQMREIKNQIFFTTLTEYALQKYNGN